MALQVEGPDPEVVEGDGVVARERAAIAEVGVVVRKVVQHHRRRVRAKEPPWPRLAVRDSLIAHEVARVVQSAELGSLELVAIDNLRDPGIFGKRLLSWIPPSHRRAVSSRTSGWSGRWKRCVVARCMPSIAGGSPPI